MMNLRDIYRPIEREIAGIEKFLNDSLKDTGNDYILRLNRFLLGSRGKRIRPALVILSAKAAKGNEFLKKGSFSSELDRQLIKIATAIELVHMASLVHDDIIDHSSIRHNKPTINSKWGEDVAITLGDYLYSVAFDLISNCGNMDVLQCITSATKAMCEGELLQVCERDNPELLKEKYIVIVKKKTASLFAASCQAGALASNAHHGLQTSLKEYGLNLGISFQIVDDYLDIVGEKAELGKIPGQDIGAGEITLPLLYMLESSSGDEAEKIKDALFSKGDERAVRELRSRLLCSTAKNKTMKTAISYVSTAKQRIEALPRSPYKESLLNLTDFIIDRAFNDKS